MIAVKHIITSSLLFCVVLGFAETANGQNPSKKAIDIQTDYEWIDEALDGLIYPGQEFAPKTSCKKLSSMFSGDGLTDLQKKKEWREYENKVIPLKGIVVDVTDLPLGKGYHATFRCVNSESYISDFTVRIPKHESEYAHSLSVGELHNVVVRLRSYGNIIGIYGDMPFIRISRNGSDKCDLTLRKAFREGNILFYGCSDRKWIAKTRQLQMDDRLVIMAEVQIENNGVEYFGARIQGLEKYSIFLRIKDDGESEKYTPAANVCPDSDTSKKVHSPNSIEYEVEKFKKYIRNDKKMSKVRAFLKETIENQKKPPLMLSCEQEAEAIAVAIMAAYIGLWGR